MNYPGESASYEFAEFSVDVVRRRLLRHGIVVPITSKAFETLLILIRNNGSTVTKSDLMNCVWGDSAVEENNLTQQISALRRALGERPNDHRFIVTVPGRGYSFVASMNATVAQTSWLTSYADASVMRGYAVAASYVLLIMLACAWSAVRGDHPQSLAVMTFRGDEFIGAGISDTLRARLGSVEDLIVRPVPADADAVDAGRRLKVDTIVTGSVQRDRDRIRVAVELVDVSDGRIVWGKTFDETSSNVFDLQDEIADEVARILTVRRVLSLSQRSDDLVAEILSV